MKETLKNFCILILLCLNVGCSFFKDEPGEEEWIKLFNGKDLQGWDVKITGHALNDNYGNTFRVEDGALKVSYDQYQNFGGKFGHLYYQKPFSHYKIRVEYRFTGEQMAGGADWNVRNSGVMLHSQSAQSMELHQDFPASLEIQLLGGLGTQERTTANLCTPGTYVEMNGNVTYEHCINSNSKTYHGDQWVTVEAIVLGDSTVSHIIDGVTVLSYQKPKLGGDDWVKNPGASLKEGYIALQAESHPIEFRKVELLNLKGCTNPKCTNYKPYHVVSDNCQCTEVAKAGKN